jgi:hypothetical protein
VTTKHDTMDVPQDPSAETGQLDASDLEEVVGGNDPEPPVDVGSEPPVDTGDSYPPR